MDTNKERPTVGITNEYYNRELIEKNLKDDIGLLTHAFMEFNKKYFNNELDNSVVIQIGSNMKTNIRVEAEDSWLKSEDNNKEKEECRGIAISENLFEQFKKVEDSSGRIVKVVRTTEEITESVYMYLVIAMIWLLDEDKGLNDKYNHTRTREKLVTRGGTYFNQGFKALCEGCHIHAEPIYTVKKTEKKNKNGEVEIKESKKYSGKLEYSVTDAFRKDLKEMNLDSDVFTCSRNKNNEKSKTKQSSRLMVCPICGLKIRVTKPDVKIKCCSGEHVGTEIFFVEDIK